MSPTSDTLSQCLTTLEKSAHSVTELSHAGYSLISCVSSGSRRATLQSMHATIGEKDVTRVSECVQGVAGRCRVYLCSEKCIT